DTPFTSHAAVIVLRELYKNLAKTSGNCGNVVKGILSTDEWSS
ncbi:unnamed protein product, partial [Callosobruchus maculatus]